MSYVWRDDKPGSEGALEWLRANSATLVESQESGAVLDWLSNRPASTVPPVSARLPSAKIGHNTAWQAAAEFAPDDAVTWSKTRLYHMEELQALRRAESLTAAEWRQVGDNQKALYRKQLLQRTGHAPAGSTDPAFEFNNYDLQNLFQLESVVEFYMNLSDPWKPTPNVVGENVPREPTDAGYITVDLLEGLHLVLIDSFGGRIYGSSATSAGHVVRLGGTPDLSRVNPNFDTLYLPSDTARPSKTYRITGVDDAAKTVTVDGTPRLNDGSRWHIPAGIGGKLPEMLYNLGPGSANGYDQFDGCLFLVKNGEIKCSQYRWNSYTSRDQDDPEYLSSIRGNKRYDFSSYKSGGNNTADGVFRNYCFKVIDHSAAYDGVREARFYFDTPVRADNAPAGSNPVDGGSGKTAIRIHFSLTDRPHDGCNSAGCIVSGKFYEFRDRMIELYQADTVVAHGVRDANVQKLYRQGHTASQDLKRHNTVTASQWDGRIRGTFWLARPDERPIG